MERMFAMRILCIGDSNTYGFDPRSYIGERYPETIRWTGLLTRHDVINWGINGIAVPHDHYVYVDLIRRKEPDLVIVMLGSNDILEGRSALQTSARMEEFIDSIRLARKKILLIAPPPLQEGEAVESEQIIKESQKLGSLYGELAARKDCLFADADKWGIELAFDGVHFSPDGHSTFAQKLEELLDNFAK